MACRAPAAGFGWHARESADPHSTDRRFGPGTGAVQGNALAQEFRPVQVDLDVLEDQRLVRLYVSGQALWERRVILMPALGSDEAAR